LLICNPDYDLWCPVRNQAVPQIPMNQFDEIYIVAGGNDAFAQFLKRGDIHGNSWFIEVKIYNKGFISG
jgi:hypothetical protein